MQLYYRWPQLRDYLESENRFELRPFNSVGIVKSYETLHASYTMRWPWVWGPREKSYSLKVMCFSVRMTRGKLVWLIFLNLTGFRNPWEIHLWACLWRHFQRDLAEDGKHIVYEVVASNGLGTRGNKRREPDELGSSSLCFLSSQTWASSLVLLWPQLRVTLDTVPWRAEAPALQVRINHSFKVASCQVFGHINKKK